MTKAFSYDPIGQSLQTQQSANGALLRTFLTSYTPTGKVGTTTDGNGDVTRLACDAADRLASVADPRSSNLACGFAASGFPGSRDSLLNTCRFTRQA